MRGWGVQPSPEQARGRIVACMGRAPSVALIYGIFFASGASALVYQTCWQRLLGLFGGSVRPRRRDRRTGAHRPRAVRPGRWRHGGRPVFLRQAHRARGRRRALLVDDRRWDVIESDAILPKTPHSGLLYSAELFDQVRSRVKEGGIAVQCEPTDGRARRSFPSFRTSSRSSRRSSAAAGRSPSISKRCSSGSPSPRFSGTFGRAATISPSCATGSPERRRESGGRATAAIGATSTPTSSRRTSTIATRANVRFGEARLAFRGAGRHLLRE